MPHNPNRRHTTMTGCRAGKLHIGLGAYAHGAHPVGIECVEDELGSQWGIKMPGDRTVSPIIAALAMAWLSDPGFEPQKKK